VADAAKGAEVDIVMLRVCYVDANVVETALILHAHYVCCKARRKGRVRKVVRNEYIC
jgi:hypothetical protein